MIRRECPICGTSWYSANTRPWWCAECKIELTDKHDKPIIIEREGEIRNETDR